MWSINLYIFHLSVPLLDWHHRHKDPRMLTWYQGIKFYPFTEYFKLNQRTIYFLQCIRDPCSWLLIRNRWTYLSLLNLPTLVWHQHTDTRINRLTNQSSCLSYPRTNHKAPRTRVCPHTTPIIIAFITAALEPMFAAPSGRCSSREESIIFFSLR